MTTMPDVTRRELLKAGAAAAVLLAPGVTLIAEARAKSPEEAASANIRWGLLIDTTRCKSDCTACVDACKNEMGLTGRGRPASDAQYIRKVELKESKTGLVRSLPLMCQHCAKPACADVCPTGASFKRADGIVLVDRHICIGCRYCMMACPYKARSFAHETLDDQKAQNPRGKGTVESCTLCVHRIDAGQVPACVESCHVNGKGAMVFGDLNNPESEISLLVAHYTTRQLRADLKADPGVRYYGI